jgi:predicted acyl esterase
VKAEEKRRKFRIVDNWLTLSAARSDVLCFTSAPLSQMCRIVGQVKLQLCVASSAPTFDVIGRYS